MTRYRVIHSTEYKPESAVTVCHNQAWLRPRTTNLQQVASHSLSISPDPSTLSWRSDTFGNDVAHFSFNEGYAHLVVRSESEVSVREPDVDRTRSVAWETARDSLGSNRDHLYEYQFCFDSRLVRTSDELGEYAREIFRPGRLLVDALEDLTHRVYEDFEYDPRATTISTPVEHVFESRKGVCQDFAHVQIAMLRSLGLAARYVSGYVRTGNVPDRPDMIGSDASHAWVAAWCPELGWIDADPTNNALTSRDHVTVAWGRDYSDVPPLRGVYIGGSQHKPSIGVSVQQLD